MSAGDYRGEVTSDDHDASPTTLVPDPAATRYRCAACGNLTRFTVVTNRRTTAFHHYSVGGELTLEDEQVLDETVEEVTCRWCGNGNAVEVIPAGEPMPQ